MPKQQVPLGQLQDYLPGNCFDEVYRYLQQYNVHLTVTRKRQSILGDYRNAYKEKNHRISVNGNLNPYSFLITLLHELAHLLTYEQFGHRVQAHGSEWKKIFGNILSSFVSKKIFPPDIENALQKSLNNPAASSCGDEHLLRTLRNYDEQKEGFTTVEELSAGTIFSIKGGRVFRKEEKIRKRHKCTEISTGKTYLFSGLYEVTLTGNTIL
jgi:predicted SprT family Zn-dependent metalloprotease